MWEYHQQKNPKVDMTVLCLQNYIVQTGIKYQRMCQPPEKCGA